MFLVKIVRNCFSLKPLSSKEEEPEILDPAVKQMEEGRKKEEEQTPMARITTSEPLMPQSTSILLLNDDCLLEIFSYLRVRELAVMEQVCHRFQDLAQDTYKRYRVFNLAKEKSTNLLYFVAEAQWMCSKVGQYIRILRGEACYVVIDILGVFLRHCTNIEELHFEDIYDLRQNLLGPIMAYMWLNYNSSKLQKIHLENCNVNDEFADFLYDVNGWININVTEVNVSVSENIYGSLLLRFRNLTKLHIAHCPNLSSVLFVEFCKYNGTLLELYIEGCTDLDQSCIDAIAQELVNLTYLSIQFSDFQNATDFMALAELPKLQLLNIFYCGKAEIPFLRRLLHHNRLIHLLITFDNVTEENILKEIMNMAMKFTYLISFTCDSPQLNDSHFKNASLNQLQRLMLMRAGITDQGLYDFVLKCPNLQKGDFEDCNLLTNEFAKKIMPDWNTKFQSLRLVFDEASNISPEYKKILSRI